MVTIEVTVRMRGESMAASPLTLSEILEVRGDSFGHLSDVLERFHELAEAIRNEQAGVAK